MFLHLGADVVINLQRVIAICDLRTAAHAAPTQAFLRQAQQQQRVTDISAGDAKSMVITDQGIFLSPISSLTLKSRAERFQHHLIDSLV